MRRYNIYGSAPVSCHVSWLLLQGEEYSSHGILRTLRNLSSLSPPPLRPPPRPPALPAGVGHHELLLAGVGHHGRLLAGVVDHGQLLAGVVDHEQLLAEVVCHELLLARLGLYTMRLGLYATNCCWLGCSGHK